MHFRAGGNLNNMRIQEGKIWHVYIMTNQVNGTLYIGFTNNLLNRVYEHKITKYPNSFASKYNLTLLVFYEPYTHPHQAFIRERQIKKWNRAWKLKLIEKDNPAWRDLYPKIVAAYQ